MQEKILVTDWAKKWIKTATAGRGQSQQEAVKNAVYKHILPCIGSMLLCEVAYADAALVMAEAAHFSYSLRSKVLINMRAMFEMARRSHIISENPCDGLKAGPRKQKERQALTEDQQHQLEMAVKSTRAETFVLVGLYTGLRREEILALQWDAIDLTSEVPTLTVKRALRWEHNKPVVSDVLKSNAAKRTIPLPKRLIEHFLLLPQKEGFVIGGPSPLTETQFKNLWAIVRRRTANTPAELGTCARNTTVMRTLDFRVTPHQLRHTYITRLVMGGANIKHVQYLAGHADLHMTLKIYTHLMNKNPAELSKTVDTAFSCC